MRIIGLDPALRLRGFAACELMFTPEQALQEITFYKFERFYHFIEFCEIRKSDANCFWAVENSNLQNVTFARYRVNEAQLKKISRNVGANQGISQAVVDMLAFYFGPPRVLQISPAKKGVKWATRTAEHVAAQYGVKLPKTSQDERDALQIALHGYTSFIIKTKHT